MALERKSAARQSVLSRKVALGDGAELLDGLIETTEAERARLATFLSIESLDSFAFRYHLAPTSSGRFLLTGKIDARLTQLCIVTLEPVSEHVEEDVALECWPQDQIEGEGEEDSETVPDALPDDPPVPIVEGKIDLGALAAELLASAINPYPRKEGVEFEWEDPKDVGADKLQSPFAELAKLKMKR